MTYEALNVAALPYSERPGAHSSWDYLRGAERFLEIVYNDFPQSPVYLGAFAENHAMRMPSSLLVMLGTFLVAYSHPR